MTKATLDMKYEIQTSTSPTKIDFEKVEYKPQVTAMESPDSAVDNLETPSEIDQGTTTTIQPETEYPTGIRFIIVTISLMLGVFMVALDTTIICTSLPPPPPNTCCHYCGVWPIKYHEGSKTNKLHCQFRKKLTFD
jgi:hypothetical protein